jgi:glycosyltransferase involved in cell wall biosynthesis
MRIWIDVSLYRNTFGTSFGIARLEEQLVKLVPKKHANVGFFWIDIDGTIKFSKEPKKNSNLELPRNSPVRKSNFYMLERLKAESILIRISVIATNLTSFFPTRVADKIWAQGRKVYFHLNTRYQKQKFNLRKDFVKKLFADNSMVPNSQDIFLIASNDWERRSYEHLENQLSFVPRLAFIIYDLIPYTNPEFAVDLETASKFTYWIGDVAQKSEYIFCISEFTESCFRKMVGERKIISNVVSKVIKLPAGISSEGQEDEPHFSAKIEEYFVLVVCTLEVRKNHKVLLRAAAEALRLGEFFPQLIFVGAKGWGYEEIRRDIELNEKLKLKVIHDANVSDTQLRWLYRNCTLVAYPSFIEGLGLPIIEAKQFGKRVLASSAEVFREILEEHDVVISPNDPIEWKIQIQQNCVKSGSNITKLASSNSWDQVVAGILNRLKINDDVSN